MNKSEKEKLLIIGASGHGKVVADIALKMNEWQRIAFLDDDEILKKSLSLDVIGNTKNLKEYVDEWDIFVAIGSNSTREKIQETLDKLIATIPVLIHPRAVIGEEVEIAEGTVVMGGVVINSSTKIGRGCIINTGSTIDHDNFIEDFVHISPGVHLAGTVKVGSRCWLGIGSIVSNNISLHRDSKIGAGAVMVKDTIEAGLYIGLPARRA
ncbi:sugar O-acyltransferase (sialic acid O-acetyltransferase NeuD family) [Planomicrobium stackebrandtii]|uniref:Sugar O-acyltransferase (Sialic acid O-acetyltransferase NeuD family) n=1 Tax=Planomicrobium stackebrandtii TaxID=253160 RepID=A0ABU0GSP4_9BACL|nr:acetyltransferase [Planomicrobium stackebrandtii]MDQ0428388.1 sugar O-acyltransferase (sialic acid O-acetyltransferase NeuD family) [Planomicrobium stackebrandtii]